MAKIICPNKDYTGVSASVSFVDGIGVTNDLYLIEWFKANGYEVYEDEQNDETSVEIHDMKVKDSYESMSYKELQALAKEKGINASGSKEEIIEKLKGESDGDEGEG